MTKEKVFLLTGFFSAIIFLFATLYSLETDKNKKECKKIEGEVLLYSLQNKDGFYCVYNQIPYGTVGNIKKKKV